MDKKVYKVVLIEKKDVGYIFDRGLERNIEVPKDWLEFFNVKLSNNNDENERGEEMSFHSNENDELGFSMKSFQNSEKGSKKRNKKEKEEEKRRQEDTIKEEKKKIKEEKKKRTKEEKNKRKEEKNKRKEEKKKRKEEKKNKNENQTGRKEQEKRTNTVKRNDNGSETEIEDENILSTKEVGIDDGDQNQDQDQGIGVPERRTKKKKKKKKQEQPINTENEGVQEEQNEKNETIVQLKVSNKKKEKKNVTHTWSRYLRDYNRSQTSIPVYLPLDQVNTTNGVEMRCFYDKLPDKIFIAFDNENVVLVSNSHNNNTTSLSNGIYTVETKDFGDKDEFDFYFNSNNCKVSFEKKKICDFCGRSTQEKCIKTVSNLLFWNKAEKNEDFEKYVNSYQVVECDGKETKGTPNFMYFIGKVVSIIKSHFFDRYQHPKDVLKDVKYDIDGSYDSETDEIGFFSFLREIHSAYVEGKIEIKPRNSTSTFKEFLEKQKTEMKDSKYFETISGVVLYLDFLKNKGSNKSNIMKCLLTDYDEYQISLDRRNKILMKLSDFVVGEIMRDIDGIKTIREFRKLVKKVSSSKYWRNESVYGDVGFTYKKRESVSLNVHYHRNNHSYSEKGFKKDDLPKDPNGITKISYDDVNILSINNPDKTHLFSVKINGTYYFRDDFCKLNNVVTYDVYGDLENDQRRRERYFSLITNKII